MKKVILISALATFFLGTPLLSEAVSQCSGTFQVNDPACWTQTTTQCVWDCNGNGSWYWCYPSGGFFTDGHFTMSSTEDGHYCYYHSENCVNNCDNRNLCENQPHNDWSITTNTCHYISSYTYGACINHSKPASGATWATTPGTSCSNAVQENWCNLPPTAPAIAGPDKCDKGVSCGPFSISRHSTDPEGDAITYNVNWGDETSAFAIMHSWASAGTKTVKVRACDSYNSCSDWSDEITVNVLACQADIADNHATACGGDETGLVAYVEANPSKLSGSSVSRTLKADCSDNTIKCKSKCNNSTTVCEGITYIYDPVWSKCNTCTINCSCAENTCIGGTCTTNCGTITAGTKDCRNTNWREVSPE